MALALRRPILVGGIILSFGLWMLESFQHSLMDMGEYVVLAAIALGAGCWWFQSHKVASIDLSPLAAPLARETVEGEIDRANLAIDQLESETSDAEAIASLRQQVAKVTADLERQELHLVVAGGKNMGKTALIKELESNWLPQQHRKITFTETPALFVATDEAKEDKKSSPSPPLPLSPSPFPCDLLLFLIAGDLTESEFQLLQQAAAEHQRMLLVFNKQDQYLPEERALLRQQLQKRTAGILKPEDVVSIAAAPGQVKVRQHQADGTIKEWMEQPNSDLLNLAPRLGDILTQERQQLVWASTWRSAVALKAEAKEILNGVRRDRALPVVEQYQWIAAATAGANPVPALDLLAAAAINAQLVMDLAAIYQQKFSFSQAQTMAETLGKLMLKLGLVELSTSTIASILKSNAVTFAAGGLVQGVSAAYLTRLAGLSSIEYFQAQEPNAESHLLNFDKLGETLQKVFQQNQRLALLQSFAQQAAARILPASLQPQAAIEQTAS
ncbi:MAG: DUF697 domain-containing protein [Cyanosarcina radialis HA8281-LM2]|jgi:hypothetical protein|nr:DUF697 domain-containing protein [Cyanosarcina radialis HA8281-LM2]